MSSFHRGTVIDPFITKELLKVLYSQRSSQVRFRSFSIHRVEHVGIGIYKIGTLFIERLLGVLNLQMSSTGSSTQRRAQEVF